MYLHNGGPRTDYVGRMVIQAVALVNAHTNNWSSLLLIQRRVDPKNGLLRHIKHQKQAPSGPRAKSSGPRRPVCEEP